MFINMLCTVIDIAIIFIVRIVYMHTYMCTVNRCIGARTKARRGARENREKTIIVFNNNEEKKFEKYASARARE